MREPTALTSFTKCQLNFLNLSLEPPHITSSSKAPLFLKVSILTGYGTTVNSNKISEQICNRFRCLCSVNTTYSDLKICKFYETQSENCGLSSKKSPSVLLQIERIVCFCSRKFTQRCRRIRFIPITTKGGWEISGKWGL